MDDCSDESEPDGVMGENSEEDEPLPHNLYAPPEEEEDSALDAYIETQKFACQILLDIGENRISQTAATSMLKNFRSTIGQFLPLNVLDLIPADWRTLKKYQTTSEDPPYVFRDFCPEDHYMFPVDATAIECPLCKGAATRYLASGASARRVLYFTLEGYMRRILSSPSLKHAITSWPDRVSQDGVLRDACDGSLMRGFGRGGNTQNGNIFGKLTPQQRRRCFVFSQCTDATVVSHIQGTSMTPVVHMCLSLPPHLRRALTAMFLAAVWPKGGSDPALLAPVLEMFKQLGPDTPGLTVDGVTYWAVYGFRVDDIRGIAKAIRAKQCPAYNGACIQCKIRGVRITNIHTTVYPGAVSFTCKECEHREKFKEVFKELPSFRQAGLNLKPQAMTMERAMKSADRMSQGGLSVEEKQMEPFWGPNIFSAILPGTDFVWQTTNDSFHEVANTMRDIFNLMRCNEKQASRMKYTRKRKAFEKTQNRFQRPKGKASEGNGWHLPFQATKASRAKLDKFVQSGRMRLPSSWPRVRYVFEYLNRLSCSELVFMAGPLGLYFLIFPDIDENIRRVFGDLITCLEELQAKSRTKKELKDLQEAIVMTLAEAETLLPVYWNTMVRHVLLHITSFIERCGPFKAQSMCGYERFHTMFKKLIRGRKNVLVQTHPTYKGNYASRRL